jgi:hypothetical protein
MMRRCHFNVYLIYRIFSSVFFLLVRLGAWNLIRGKNSISDFLHSMNFSEFNPSVIWCFFLTFFNWDLSEVDDLSGVLWDWLCDVTFSRQFLGIFLASTSAYYKQFHFTLHNPIITRCSNKFILLSS